MSKKKAKEICKNLYRTIFHMNNKLPIHNEEMFDEVSTRIKKSSLKNMYNKLIKKYGFRRRFL